MVIIRVYRNNSAKYCCDSKQISQYMSRPVLPLSLHSHIKVLLSLPADGASASSYLINCTLSTN